VRHLLIDRLPHIGGDHSRAVDVCRYAVFSQLICGPLIDSPNGELAVRSAAADLLGTRSDSRSTITRQIRPCPDLTSARGRLGRSTPTPDTEHAADGQPGGRLSSHGLTDKSTTRSLLHHLPCCRLIAKENPSDIDRVYGVK